MNKQVKFCGLLALVSLFIQPILHAQSTQKEALLILAKKDQNLAIVDPAQLNQNVAAWAAVLYTLANSDVDFRHLPPAKPFEFP